MSAEVNFCGDNDFQAIVSGVANSVPRVLANHLMTTTANASQGT